MLELLKVKVPGELVSEAARSPDAERALEYMVGDMVQQHLKAVNRTLQLSGEVAPMRSARCVTVGPFSPERMVYTVECDSPRLVDPTSRKAAALPVGVAPPSYCAQHVPRTDMPLLTAADLAKARRDIVYEPGPWSPVALVTAQRGADVELETQRDGDRVWVRARTVAKPTTPAPAITMNITPASPEAQAAFGEALKKAGAGFAKMAVAMGMSKAIERKAQEYRKDAALHLAEALGLPQHPMCRSSLTEKTTHKEQAMAKTELDKKPPKAAKWKVTVTEYEAGQQEGKRVSLQYLTPKEWRNMVATLKLTGVDTPAMWYDHHGVRTCMVQDRAGVKRYLLREALR